MDQHALQLSNDTTRHTAPIQSLSTTYSRSEAFERTRGCNIQSDNDDTERSQFGTGGDVRFGEEAIQGQGVK